MLSVKNRIIKTSRRDFRVNKLLFIITNLVLFINFIMQMSMRKFITYYSESVTNSYTGYGLAQAGSVAIALLQYLQFLPFSMSFTASHTQTLRILSQPVQKNASSQSFSPC